jgi:hypothetical protein
VALPQVTSSDAVWAAVDEYDEIGGHAFHEKYGFGPSDAYLIRARGRLYDSKAILAAAQGYEDATLGAAANEFSGGGQVRRRLKHLGFDVIVDRRCGDLLKLVPRIRTSSDDGSQRVYKPLLLLDALGRAARGEARLLPFTVYEDSLEALLAEVARSHGDAAIANAWWRLPGDELWEVAAQDRSILRPAGERAGAGPPSMGELRTQVGGLPEPFYSALREVPELAPTATHLLLDRFFGGLAPEQKTALLAIAGATDPIPTGIAEDIHLVVKWITSYEPETIGRHREIVDKRGAVWWGVFSRNERTVLAEQWLQQLREQLAEGRETCIFISGDSCWRTRLHQIETNRELVDPELIPNYYARVAAEPPRCPGSSHKPTDRSHTYKTACLVGGPNRELRASNSRWLPLGSSPRRGWKDASPLAADATCADGRRHSQLRLHSDPRLEHGAT